MNRGFLAEYRAWTSTFALYIEAKATGANPIEWAETVLGERLPRERLDRFVFRFLDAGFEDPREGVYAYPIVRQALAELRAELRNRGEPPSLDSIGLTRPDLLP